MVQDNFNHSTLTQQTDFDIKTFLDLLLSEYVAIQNLTLDVLDNLTRQTKGNRVPTDFQNAGGVTLLLRILKVIILQFHLINLNVILSLLSNFLYQSNTLFCIENIFFEWIHHIVIMLLSKYRTDVCLILLNSKIQFSFKM